MTAQSVTGYRAGRPGTQGSLLGKNMDLSFLQRIQTAPVS
jgi:hypothetical protein